MGDQGCSSPTRPPRNGYSDAVRGGLPFRRAGAITALPPAAAGDGRQVITLPGEVERVLDQLVADVLLDVGSAAVQVRGQVGDFLSQRGPTHVNEP